jgi:hypothetical protein
LEREKFKKRKETRKEAQQQHENWKKIISMIKTAEKQIHKVEVT